MVSGLGKQNSIIADCANSRGNQMPGSKQMKKVGYTNLVDFSQRLLVVFFIYLRQFNTAEVPPPEYQSRIVIIEEQKNKRLKGPGPGGSMLRGTVIVL